MTPTTRCDHKQKDTYSDALEMLIETHAERSTYGRMNKKVNEDESPSLLTTVPDKTNVRFETSAPKLHSAEHRAYARRDEELLPSLREGSPSAFETLQRLYSRRLFKQIIAITRNYEDAEDALQETFLKAFRRIETFEGRSQITTWLSRIAINNALMKVRKRRSLSEMSFEQTSDSDERPVTHDLPDPALGPEQIYEQQEQLKHLRDAVKHLSPRLRAVVNVWLATDCSTDEIADNLGLSAAAVKTRISRARRRLCDSLLSHNRGKKRGYRVEGRQVHETGGNAA